MAFFKLRLPGRLSSGPSGADALSNSPAESVEVVRKRARHRLMGSVVLVLGAVVGLPLLFDSQPRPVAIDTPIVIPDRNQAAPLTSSSVSGPSLAPKERAVPEPLPTTTDLVVAPKTSMGNAAGLDPHEEVVTKDTKTDLKSEPKAEPKAEPKPEPKAELKAEPKTETKKDVKPEVKEGAKDAAKAKALLDGKDAAKSGEAVRSVVQVGAYADLAKAKEARAKLESAGFKTYTQEVETKDGKRIRVRVGPFATKEEADKTAEKIRKLNLQTSVLKL
jgi:DedD protein